MGLLSRLFGKKPAADASVSAASAETAEAGIAPVLQAALDHYQHGRLAEALAQATTQTEAADASVRADALRLCALALSQMGRYADAFPHWLALFGEEPSAHNALQLATTSVMCGEAHRGEAWLVKFDQINQETREMPWPQARTNFISACTQSGHEAHALAPLAELRDAQAAVHVTDPTFLYMRGMPGFGEFLQRSLPILRNALPAEAIAPWYAVLDGQLDDAGQQALQQHLLMLGGTHHA